MDDGVQRDACTFCCTVSTSTEETKRLTHLILPYATTLSLDVGESHFRAHQST